MNNKPRFQQVVMLMEAGDFFEDDFPRAKFRQLLWEAALEETDDWERKVELQDIAVFWSDAKIYAWRARMDDDE